MLISTPLNESPFSSLNAPFRLSNSVIFLTVTLDVFINSSLNISCFNSGEIFSPLTLILFISFKTVYLLYSNEYLGRTSSPARYVHLQVILLINPSSDLSKSTMFSKFHGYILPSALRTIHTLSVSFLFTKGPTK